MTLAIDGGKPAVRSPLRPYTSISEAEIAAAVSAIRAGPLSGYLGGQPNGGLRVETLEHEFAQMLGVKHAVACNSATSGLLLACVACGVGAKSTVVCSPYTMSASAAAPAFLGARILFIDIEDKTYGLNLLSADRSVTAVIVTNLFGHAANLWPLRELTYRNKIFMIEDNAQSPFAIDNGKYAGTIGDVGVWSMNVHKHLQCGEGGICTTNNDFLADFMRKTRNHAELFK